MKAFFSYSLNDNEQYIVTLLAKKLQESGFFVASGFGTTLKDVLNFEIKSSNLFIGLLSQSGKFNKRVYEEWNYALKSKVPSILLVENTIQLQNGLIGHPNVVFFDRKHPKEAIIIVNQKIEKAIKDKKLNGAVAWVLGGVAALALIGMLAEE